MVSKHCPHYCGVVQKCMSSTHCESCIHNSAGFRDWWHLSSTDGTVHILQSCPVVAGFDSRHVFKTRSVSSQFTLDCTRFAFLILTRHDRTKLYNNSVLTIFNFVNFGICANLWICLGSPFLGAQYVLVLWQIFQWCVPCISAAVLRYSPFVPCSAAAK